MQLHEAIAEYQRYLGETGFGEKETERKVVILRRHLSYALALFHPPIANVLLNLSEFRLYSRGTITERVRDSRLAAAKRFTRALAQHSSDQIRYVTVAAFLHQYDLDQANSELPADRRAAKDLLRAVALGIEIGGISRTTYDQVLNLLKDTSVDRACGYADLFFRWCDTRFWLSFHPPAKLRRPYDRIFDVDFLGTQGGFWTDRLGSYVKYLNIEKHLSDGGIDYYARKLRVFVRWLDDQGAKTRVTARIIEDFLDSREKLGVNSSTRAKYVYSLRYFFDFLIYRGLEKVNPANGLSAKADLRPEQPILSELEVVKVIEHLEDTVFRNEKATDIKQRMAHFRAVRDLCLFLLFTLTGVRLSEAWGVRIDEIDFVRRSLRIAAKGNRAERKKYRDILLPDALWKRLIAYLRVRSMPANGHLWISWSGRPLSI